MDNQVGLAPGEQGLRCEDLLVACRRSAAVTDFFHSVLSRDRPLAPFRTSHQPFAQRMAELQDLEVRHATQQRIQELRPRTVDPSATSRGGSGVSPGGASSGGGGGSGSGSFAGSRLSRSQGSPGAASGAFERFGTPGGRSISSSGSCGRLPPMPRATSSGTLPQLQPGGPYAGRSNPGRTLADQALMRYQPSTGNILGAVAIEAHRARKH